MRSSSPLPFSLSLVCSALAFAAALILLWLAAMHWRHARRPVPVRPRRVVVAWRVFGAGYALWALWAFGLAGLSLVYPFDGRGLIHPPAGSVGMALEIVSYAMVPTGLAAFVAGRVLLHRAYRT